MRPQFLTSALLLLAGCSNSLPPRDPPSTSFAYPSALVHAPAPGGDGTLYVASSNFDKFYDSGAVLAVNLDSVGEGGVLSAKLPAFVAPPPPPEGQLPPPPVEILLNVPETAVRFIQSISGEMALYRSVKDGTPYLFVPSRAEGDLLQVLRINGPNLECVGTDSKKCYQRAVSLSESAGSADGLPGAPAPIGVAVGLPPPPPPGAQQRPAELWVTHISAALTREGDNRSAAASTYVVKADPDAIVAQLQSEPPGAVLLPTDNFVLLDRGRSPLAGAHSVAVGPDFAFLSGRAVANASGGTLPFLLRGISRTNPALFSDPPLRSAYPDVEARGVALNSAGTRLYLAGRATGSTLLVADVISTPTSLGVNVVRAIDTLPPGASAVQVLSRGAGRGDLVLITCSTAGVLAVYDDEVGDIVAQVPDLGDQPYALAVESRPRTTPAGTDGARVFVGNFGDGQVSVIDIYDLNNPQGSRIVARLGTVQRCATDTLEGECTEDSP